MTSYLWRTFVVFVILLSQAWVSELHEHLTTWTLTLILMQHILSWRLSNNPGHF